MMKKVNSGIYCHRKFKKFGVSVDFLLMLYNAVISSTISFGAACWDGNVSKHDKRKVDKVIHRASRIVGRELNNVQSLHRGKVLNKANTTEVVKVTYFLWSAEEVIELSGSWNLPEADSNSVAVCRRRCVHCTIS